MIGGKIHVFFIVAVTLVATPSLAQNNPFGAIGNAVQNTGQNILGAVGTVGGNVWDTGVAAVEKGDQFQKKLTDATDSVGKLVLGPDFKTIEILDQLIGINTKEVLEVLGEIKNHFSTGFKYVTFEVIVKLFTKIVNFAGQIYFHDRTFKIEDIIVVLQQFNIQEIIANINQLVSVEGVSVVNRLNEHTVHCVVDAAKVCTTKIVKPQAFAFCLAKYIMNKGLTCFPAKNNNQNNNYVNNQGNNFINNQDNNYVNNQNNENVSNQVGDMSNSINENYQPCVSAAHNSCKKYYSSDNDLQKCVSQVLTKVPNFCLVPPSRQFGFGNIN